MSFIRGVRAEEGGRHTQELKGFPRNEKENVGWGQSRRMLVKMHEGYDLINGNATRITGM